jgi:hypothetical protein
MGRWGGWGDGGDGGDGGAEIQLLANSHNSKLRTPLHLTPDT